MSAVSLSSKKGKQVKMSSVTGDFTTLTNEGNIEENLNSRNALSTVKRKCQRRKIVNIVPLRLVEIEKELEEAENEIHSKSKSAIKTEEHNKENKCDNEIEVPKLQDSFELDFASLSLTTPAKQKQIINDGNFVTPKLDYKPIKKPSDIPNRMLDYQYVTPKNKITPKIQCSVNMQTYLKTPIDQLNVISTKLTVKNSKQDCDVKLNDSPETLFKKIYVNKVEYIILNELGKGGSSEVFHCYNIETKSHRAIKCVSLHNPSSAVGFINEVKMLQKLQTCNRIIKLFDFEIVEETKILLLVLEVGGADLSKILKESAINTDHMPVYMLLYYWMEMLYAVKQIHSKGIIHSDLKPANFLKVEGYLKLIDFGIASCVQNDLTSVIKAVPVGSFNYISPEALNNESSTNANSPTFNTPKYKISYKSDVWSLGCILYQMVYRKTPFQHITQMWPKLSTILNPHHKIEYPEAGWVPQKIIDTMKKCLQYNVKMRPSVDDLISEYESLF